MATLQDVARVAGVSMSTVSYVLNNRTKHFSPETRDQVLAAMKEVGYVRNTVARSLVRNRTDTIGVLISNLIDEPFVRALRAAQRVFHSAGYDVIVTDTGVDINREKQALANMQSRRVDGVLFISTSRMVDNSHLLEFNSQDLPFVVVNRYLPSGVVDQIKIDNNLGVQMAVAHLAAQGHCDIGCLHMPLKGTTATVANIERFNGFNVGMLAAKLDIRKEWLAEGANKGDFGVQSGFVLTQRILSGKRPTALVCTNDYLAVGAFRAAAAQGLRVPEDLALTGHDNTAIARYHTPELTSVAQPIAEASAKAAQRLLVVISGKAEAGQNAWMQILPTQLIERASSCCNHTPK